MSKWWRDMASVTWDGMDEELAALAALPDDLGAAGGLLAIEAANQAAVAMKAAYPRTPDRREATTPEGRTLIRFTSRGPVVGSRHMHLQDGIVVREKILDYGARVKVVNVAPHAAPYEYGRQTGVHGQTPARPTFIPIRETYQLGLIDALRKLLESRGATVSGEAGQ